MDFSVGGWAVGEAADDLNSSLFNPVHQPRAAKKQQTHLKKTPAKIESDVGKTKVSKNVSSRPMLEGKKNENKQKLSKGRKESEKAYRIPPTEESDHNVTHCSPVNGIKRKAQQGENQSPSKKQKNVQQVSPTDYQNTYKGEKKKRKKKNSNKRNKYKHLSVMKNEIIHDDVDSGSVTVQPPGDRPTGETILGKERRQSGVKHTNTSDTVENVYNKVVLPGSQGKKTKKKDKITDPFLKKLKQNKCDKTLINDKDLVQPGVKSNRKQGKERVNEKFQVKVLDKMLSASPPSVSVSKQPVQAESSKSGQTTLSLKQRMLDKLKSARFRFLNEQLYSQTGSESYVMFEQDKEAFQVYHQGFQSQVAKWPVNPVSVIIGQLQARSQNLVVADFGCGDAIIARTLPNKVHSFDLVATNKHVTACDMAKVPLKNESVDVAVFCLSLMGKNLPDYLREASRVIKPGGSLKVAEVTSRIRSLPNFKKTMDNFGFRLLNEDTTNRMFCLFDFKKCKLPKKPPAEFHLEPCLYKRR
ncbi:Ribosomal RNA-processing protein 8 [Mizuhopecten yessoensis]|uniref:Ribosomal RNA-processing protein 8 n=2 Tax=Mizuhopecten yessoensis TaxID=6573 RepID=A0A210QE63_MIZYE|nr:Ribosomal RNA-processing protein 8 [Mizuhopecten yessoensis]